MAMTNPERLFEIPGNTRHLAISEPSRVFASNLGDDGESLILGAACFEAILEKGGLAQRIEKALEKLNPDDTDSLEFWSEQIRRIILSASLPSEIWQEVERTMRDISSRYTKKPIFAVQTIVAEEGFNRLAAVTRGIEDLRRAILEGYAVLFAADVIERRKQMGFSHLKATLFVNIRVTINAPMARVMKEGKER